MKKKKKTLKKESFSVSAFIDFVKLLLPWTCEMSSSRVQLVRWTVPAFALILGLIWYKRRRAERADPGGENDLKISCRGKKLLKGKDVGQNLNDSGFHFDESFTSSASIPIKTEIVCSPRQVSESLDIPQRKSTAILSAATPITSLAGSDPDAWYKDVEMTADAEAPIAVQAEAHDSIPKQQTPVIVKSRSKSPYETAKTTVRKQISKMLEQTDESKPDIIIDEIKIQERTTSDRDSANHSPVSGVLDGSVSDEARSEGSSDSGKGISSPFFESLSSLLPIFRFL